MSNRRLQALVRFAFAAGTCVPFSTAVADPNTPDWDVNQMNGAYVQNQADVPISGNRMSGDRMSGGTQLAGSQADQIFARGMQMLQRDPRSAAEQFGQAARMGHPMAQLNLGVMCFNGEGIARNPAEAYVWYSLAARSGVQVAGQYAQDAGRQLNPQQRAAAEQRIQQLAGAARGMNGQAGGQRQQALGSNGTMQSSGGMGGGGGNSFPPSGINTGGGSFGGQTGGGSPAGIQGTELWDLGFFRMNKPRGWQMTAAGSGPGFCFLGQDPSRPTRQFFQLGSVGMVFPSEADKRVFGQLMQYSPQPVDWQRMVVVAPFEPANLLQHFGQIASHPAVQQAFPKFPVLQNLQIVSRQPSPVPIPDPSAKCEILRARFTLNGEACEGLFGVITTVIQGNVQLGVAGYGSAMMMGMIAPAGELAQLEGTLDACLKSQKFSEAYMQSQRAASQAALEGGRDRSKIIAETGDYVRDLNQRGFAYRDKMSDIGQQRFTDSIRGTERMYNPETGNTLEFNQGFHNDVYDLNRNQFEMNNLQQVPYDMNNYNRLMQPALDGYREIR